MTRIILTKEQAVGMLPDKKYIHTFRSAAGILLGCDWSRADILKAIEAHDVELSGPAATGMDHGMCLKDDQGWLFIEAKQP